MLNEFKFTLISSEDKEQETLPLISQSPCALSMGTAWKVLLQPRRCNVMATTLRRRPGCELRTLVNCAFFSSHWGRCLFPDSTKSWFLLIHEKNKPGILRLAAKRMKYHPMDNLGLWCSLLTPFRACLPFFTPHPCSLPLTEPTVAEHLAGARHHVGLCGYRRTTQMFMVNAKRKQSLMRQGTAGQKQW